LEVGPDGAMYVLQHLTGQVTRIQSTAAPVGKNATLSAASDAYVREGASANTNFGSATQLQTKASVGFGYNRQAYLTFNLSGVGPVQHAVLRLYGQLSQADNPISVGVFGVADTSWGERTITWNKRPAATSGAVAAATVSGTGPRWYEWDVTSYVKQQKGAGRSNVSLLLRNLVTSTGFVIFSSREAGNTGPQLVVTSS
jgi:endoglucanase